jgi:hypothetical protein
VATASASKTSGRQAHRRGERQGHGGDETGGCARPGLEKQAPCLGRLGLPTIGRRLLACQKARFAGVCDEDGFCRVDAGWAPPVPDRRGEALCPTLQRVVRRREGQRRGGIDRDVSAGLDKSQQLPRVDPLGREHTARRLPCIKTRERDKEKIVVGHRAPQGASVSRNRLEDDQRQLGRAAPNRRHTRTIRRRAPTPACALRDVRPEGDRRGWRGPRGRGGRA